MKTLAFTFIALVPFIFMMCGSSDPGAKKDSVVSPDTTIHSNAAKPLSDLPLQVSFSSIDGIAVTADNYFSADSLPWILLCHQAHYSRGEYRETAPIFRSLGFNCLAIDQRSGNEVNGVKNETAQRAKDAGKPTEYLDAEQDIIAAVNYLYEFSKKPIIIVGSSYSAGLALKVANGNPLIKAVLAFSPGEYYGSKLNLTKTVSTLDKPVFITCAKSEVKDVQKIFDAIPAQKKMFYQPTVEGIHASSCLWSGTDGHEEYWSAVKEFLAGIN
ncbi:MAG TPA: dienelactone hydrolase family protein [Bacteroidia bacterium]|jgi:dienelactone hydrolase|nr:dienelactone hydrolase family protein [Bacteroidia bacterium]